MSFSQYSTIGENDIGGSYGVDCFGGKSSRVVGNKLYIYLPGPTSADLDSSLFMVFKILFKSLSLPGLLSMANSLS